MEAEFRLIETSLKEVAAELNVQQKLKERLVSPTSTDSTNDIPLSSNTQIIISCPNLLPDEPLTTNQQKQQIVLNSANKSLRCITDQFVPVVTAFLDSARKLLREAQMMHREMEEKVNVILIGKRI